jgi:DNA-binding LytR/AlgR family response regulator
MQVTTLRRIVQRITNRNSEPMARSNDLGVIMSDVSASQMHDSPERTDVRAVVDSQWVELDARKPVVEPKHNSSAVGTAQARSGESDSSISHRRTAPGERGVRIAIQSKGRVLLFDASKLVAIEAQGNYVLLQQQTCSHLFRKSISKVEETLGPYGFVRIHRSVVVNSAHVEEIQSSPTGDYHVRMRSGKTYNVGRRYTTNLRLLAEAWIDTES